MKKFLSLLISVLILSAVPTSAFAKKVKEYQKPQTGPYQLTEGEKAAFIWSVFQRTYPELNLSEKQTIKIQEIHIKLLIELDSIKEATRAKEWQIERINLVSRASSAKKERINALRTEVNDLNTRMYEAYKKSMAEVEAVLTKKQWKKFKQSYQ